MWIGIRLLCVLICCVVVIKVGGFSVEWCFFLRVSDVILVLIVCRYFSNVMFFFVSVFYLIGNDNLILRIK